MNRTECIQKAEQWCDAVSADSAFICKSVYASKYDDTAGYGYAVCKYLELLNTSAGGLWLSGPEGTGKHNAAYFAVKRMGYLNCIEYSNILDTGDDTIDLSDKDVYIPTIFLSGADLCFTEDPAAEADIYWECLLGRYMKKNGVCIVLDNMEQCSCSEIVMERLGRHMCRYPDSEEYVIVILFDSGTLRVPHMLSKHLMRIAFLPPNNQMREMCIKKRWCQLEYAEDNKWKSAFESMYYFPPIALELSQAAELTEGYSFRQVREFAENAFYLGKAFQFSYDPDAADFESNTRCLTERLGVSVPENADEPEISPLLEMQMRQYEDRHNLTEQILSLLPDFLQNVLPDLLTKLKDAQHASSNAQPEQKKPKVMLKPDRNLLQHEADAMTGGQLHESYSKRLEKLMKADDRMNG